MNWKDIVIIVLFILFIILSLAMGIVVHKYSNAQKQVVIWTDSTEVYKNKYNEEYLAKNTYIMQADQLKSYNDELYKEYKALKDNPVVITKTETVFVVDSIKAENSNVIQDSLGVAWEWDVVDKDNWYSINGKSSIKYGDQPETFINKLQIRDEFTLDVVDDGNQLKVIAKSENPYSSLSNMKSVVIDPTNSPTIKNTVKQKRWGFGPTISAGIYTGYDFTTGKVCVGAGGMIGFSIHYDLIQW